MGDEKQVDAAILEKLRSVVAARSRTDKQISMAWIIVPIVQVIANFTLVILVVEEMFSAFQCIFSQPSGSPPSQLQACESGLLGLVGPTSYYQLIPFVIGCAYAYLVYLLIKRRNRHFARLKVLRTDIIAALREAERSRGVDIEGDLMQAETGARVAEQFEGEKNDVLFAFMVFLYGIPYIGLLGFIILLYSFYFLQKDWKRHDEVEDVFFRWVQHAAFQLGIQANYSRTKSLPSRSAALYIVGAIFTGGIFNIYWVYTLINDPNGHLKDHPAFEDSLMSALASTARSAT